MKHLIFILLVAGAIEAQAQILKKKMSAKLDEKLDQLQIEWVSLDDDHLMDIVLAGEKPDGQWEITSLQNLGDGNFKKQSSIDMNNSFGFFLLEDWDKDNRVDVIIPRKLSGDKITITILSNNGDFTFSPKEIATIDGNSMELADLNNDGQVDIASFVAGQLRPLRVYENKLSAFSLAYDSIGIQINDLLIHDFNNDGLKDIAISGSTPALVPVIHVLRNLGDFKFESFNLDSPVDGKLESIDLNDDSYFDLVAIGLATDGNIVKQSWVNDEGIFSTPSSAVNIQANALFLGDMNSDGQPDQLLTGINNTGNKTSFLFDANGTLQELDTIGVIVQRAGDFDRDGDLDIAMVIDSAEFQLLRLYENTTPTENKRPEKASGSFAISTFNKTFIYWEPSIDDHTSVPSLTYDVWLGTDKTNLVVPQFDQKDKWRKSVKHGNAGSANSFVINNLKEDRYFYLIQTVDNAYNGSGECEGGGVLPCFDLEKKYFQLCKNEIKVLQASGEALWFSSSLGFLAKSSFYEFTALASDTLFSFVPQSTDCSKNNIWVISVNEETKTEQDQLFACKDSVIKLGISPGWRNINWALSDPIQNTDTILYTVLKADTVTVTAGHDNQCAFQKKFVINPSASALSLNGEKFKILKGESVQLLASGSFESYLWSPSTGLNNSSVSNPIARPIKNTLYTVTATDSIGCTVSGQVTIEVEETAFVPNLFTPNGDGNNDNILIYGVTDASTFKFQIFNREGSLVYETSNVIEAVSRGWDGTNRGTPQPSGLYYWKISGFYSNGGQLLLNGKESGSILLVR